VRDVRLVPLARLHEGRLALKVLVSAGQAQATGDDVGDEAFGLVVVHHSDDPEPDRNGQGMETPDAPLEVGPTPDRIDVDEERHQRRETQTLEVCLVHARRVVIAEESFAASPRPVFATRELLEQPCSWRLFVSRAAARRPQRGCWAGWGSHARQGRWQMRRSRYGSILRSTSGVVVAVSELCTTAVPRAAPPGRR
jgi:hypothetical protein